MDLLHQPKGEASLRLGGSFGIRWRIEKKPRWLTRIVLKWLLEVEVLGPMP